MFLRLLLVAILLACTTAKNYSSLTTKQVAAINTRLKTVMDNSPQKPKSLLATFVRLAFHDCAGGEGCNGCINVNLPSNLGLNLAVDALEVVYKDMKLANMISRADFWALAGICAATYGAQQLGPKAVVPTGKKSPPFAAAQQLLCDCPSPTGHCRS
jgi:hypothetical protein